MKKQNSLEFSNTSLDDPFDPKYQENPALVKYKTLVNFSAYLPGGQYRSSLYFIKSNETHRNLLIQIQGLKAEKKTACFLESNATLPLTN